jgi:hypothetical protein
MGVKSQLHVSILPAKMLGKKKISVVTLSNYVQFQIRSNRGCYAAAFVLSCYASEEISGENGGQTEMLRFGR